MKLILTALLIGLAAGLLGALCGVGGGIVMVPAFVTVLGLAQKQAVATSMAVIVVTSAVATISNGTGSELIKWKIVAITAIAAALAAWYGSEWMRKLSDPTLTRIFGILLIAFGVKMLWKA
ncbi:MAG: sulfite exporter TauE/SafE family protein [Akkermansiaceae bacterium]|nr:sulfite exporter TauE/SafE family protein [Akkermansiaceae bacterium]